MDPKQNPPLDPKLKEAYDRVMGFTVADAAPTSTAPVQDPMAPQTATPLAQASDTTAPAMPSSDPSTPVANPLQSAMPTDSSQTPPLPAPVLSTPPSDPTTPSQDALSPTLPTETTTPTMPANPILSIDPTLGALDTKTPPTPSDTTPVVPSPTPESPALDTSVTLDERPAPQLGGIPEVTSSPLPTPDLNISSSSQTPDSLAAAMPLPAAVHASETVHVGALSNANDAKKAVKKGISPLIILFGGIVLLLAYILFWVRVFNLPIPFISQ